MGALIMVTGGVRSGKSVFAEEMVKGFGDSVLYIATGVAVDEEMRYRIKRHRELRPAQWDTLEAFRGIDQHIEDVGAGYDAIMLDCVTVMVSNLFGAFGDIDWETAGLEQVLRVEKEIRAEVERVITAAKVVPAPVVFVTTEIGCGAPPRKRGARVFRDIACRINTQLAAQADEVYLLVSGLPMKLK